MTSQIELHLKRDSYTLLIATRDVDGIPTRETAPLPDSDSLPSLHATEGGGMVGFYDVGLYVTYSSRELRRKYIDDLANNMRGLGWDVTETKETEEFLDANQVLVAEDGPLGRDPLSRYQEKYGKLKGYYLFNFAWQGKAKWPAIGAFSVGIFLVNVILWRLFGILSNPFTLSGVIGPVIFSMFAVLGATWLKDTADDAKTEAHSP